MEHKKSAYRIQGIQTAFELLEYLAGTEPEASLQTLTARTGLSRNKMYRILATLCETGFVEQHKSSGKYRLGLKSFSVAQQMIRNSNVINLAHPVIEQLARKHDEAVYMTIIKGDDVLFVDMADCEQQVKAVPLLGRTFPYFTNAAGKAMKALESAEIIEWLTSRKRGKIRNIEDPETLASELIEIRSNGGVAVDTGGLGEGIISIAVAVKDYAGQVTGAITMLGPSFRLVRERIENEIIPSLTEGAFAVSQRLGYMPA